MKLFIVTETSSHYNDEYYTLEREGGGTPVKAFTTKDKAKEELKKLKVEWIKKNDIFDYSEDYGYVISDPYSFSSALGMEEKEFNELANTWDYRKVYDLMKGKEEELVDYIGLEPYQITEITLED